MKAALSVILLVVLTIIPSTCLAADTPHSLHIDRITLYFDNLRAETTVERGSQKLRASVDLRYKGSGLLEGHWEVDGRAISMVSQHLDNRQNITLQTPKSPGIPTFDPGTHTIRFVITNPAVDLPVPSILYFVLPKEAKKAKAAMKPNSPEDGSELEYGPVTFSWQQVPDAAVYLISFYVKGGTKPVYSALSKEAVFELNSQTLGGVFAPGKRYTWKVTGYDVDKHKVSEQKSQSFSFRK